MSRATDSIISKEQDPENEIAEEDEQILQMADDIDNYGRFG